MNEKSKALGGAMKSHSVQHQSATKDESQNREGPKIRVQSPSKRTISVEDFGASSILRHPKQRKIPLLGTPNALYNNFLYIQYVCHKYGSASTQMKDRCLFLATQRIASFVSVKSSMRFRKERWSESAHSQYPPKESKQVWWGLLFARLFLVRTPQSFRVLIGFPFGVWMATELCFAGNLASFCG